MHRKMSSAKMSAILSRDRWVNDCKKTAIYCHGALKAYEPIQRNSKQQVKNPIHLTHIGSFLTHWGRVTHICVSKLTIIGSDNGLSPGRRQAIIWTNAGILLIRTLRTNFSETLGKIHSFSFKKMHLKMSSAKGRLFSLGLNELTKISRTTFKTGIGDGIYIK